MTKKSFISEHKKLVKTLKHPTKAGIKAELKDQSKELKEMAKAKKGAKKK